MENDTDEEIDCRFNFLIDHRSTKVKTWNFYIHTLCIFSSFLYAHYAAYRHEDHSSGSYMLIIEISFLIDLIFRFNMTYDDPRGAALKPIQNYEKIAERFFNNGFFEHLIPLVPFQLINVSRNR